MALRQWRTGLASIHDDLRLRRFGTPDFRDDGGRGGGKHQLLRQHHHHHRSSRENKNRHHRRGRPHLASSIGSGRAEYTHQLHLGIEQHPAKGHTRHAESHLRLRFSGPYDISHSARKRHRLLLVRQRRQRNIHGAVKNSADIYMYNLGADYQGSISVSTGRTVTHELLHHEFNLADNALGSPRPIETNIFARDPTVWLNNSAAASLTPTQARILYSNCKNNTTGTGGGAGAGRGPQAGPDSIGRSLVY